MCCAVWPETAERLRHRAAQRPSARDSAAREAERPTRSTATRSESWHALRAAPRRPADKGRRGLEPRLAFCRRCPAAVGGVDERAPSPARQALAAVMHQKIEPRIARQTGDPVGSEDSERIAAQEMLNIRRGACRVLRADALELREGGTPRSRTRRVSQSAVARDCQDRQQA